MKANTQVVGFGCCNAPIKKDSLLFAFFVHERVVVPLHLENAAVALAFPFGDGIHLVPCLEQLAVLFGQINTVCLFHVKVGARDNSAGFFTGLSLLELEIDNRLARAVHGFRIVGPLAIHKIVSVAVHFANGGVEVVKVAFHQLEGRVVRAAILASSIAPAGEMLSHIVGGYHVFPFDRLGALKALALRIVARCKIAGGKIDVFFVLVAAAAVKGFLKFSVINTTHLLRSLLVVVVVRRFFGIDA